MTNVLGYHWCRGGCIVVVVGVVVGVTYTCGGCIRDRGGCSGGGTTGCYVSMAVVPAT